MIFGQGRVRRALQLAVLLLTSVLVGLGIGELAVRYALRGIGGTSDNSSFFARRWKSQHPPDLNSLGFREREIQPKKPGTYRIIVLGDSFTYGQGLLREDRLTEMLERRLNASRPGEYEVLNFGAPGFNTVHELGLLDQVIGFSPDFLLLQWFVNDLDGEKTALPPVRRLLPSDFLTSWLHRRSALYYVVNSGWGSLQEWVGLKERYVDFLHRRFADPNGQASLRGIGDLDAFLQRVREEGLPTAVVLWPLLDDGADHSDDYPVGFLLDRVLQVCASHGVRCVDLRPAFATVSPRSKLRLNPLDDHPSRLANELAVAAVSEQLSQLSLGVSSRGPYPEP